MPSKILPAHSNAFVNSGPKRLLIDGEWRASRSGEVFTSINPTTSSPITDLYRGCALDVDDAVLAARAALARGWAKERPFERQAILLKLADLVDRHFHEIAELEAIDFGAPISRVLASKQRIIGLIRYYASLAVTIQGVTTGNSLAGRHHTYTIKEPLGVVGAIIPWNAPTTMTLWKIAPAIAAGCSVVLKPSEEASLAPLRIAELAIEAGLPRGVLNVVLGFGDVGEALASHMDIDMITFTGSTTTGSQIVRSSARNVKRVTLELGGKSPNVVFADADLDAAAAMAARAAFANSGQVCAAGSRLYVQKSILPHFQKRLVDAAKKIRVGDSLDPLTEMGPLASARQLDRVSTYVDSAKDGAEIVHGGRRLTDTAHSNGFFFPPTIISGVTQQMPVAREEIFGPVLSVLAFEDLDEVIQMANDSDLALGSGVWTSNISTAQKFIASVDAGTVWVNCYLAVDPSMPFGGFKRSGYGKESGIDHMDYYLRTKSVVLNYTD